MSDITALEHGQLTLSQFIVKVGGEFASSPLVKMFAPVALYAIQLELTPKLGATLAGYVVADIAAVMNGQTPNITAQMEQEAASLFGSVVASQTAQVTEPAETATE